MIGGNEQTKKKNGDWTKVGLEMYLWSFDMFVTQYFYSCKIYNKIE